jgi:hypothetical protein
MSPLAPNVHLLSCWRHRLESGVMTTSGISTFSEAHSFPTLLTDMASSKRQPRTEQRCVWNRQGHCVT